MNPDFRSHREDVDHAAVDLEATMAEFGAGREMRIGFEAIAALKAHLCRSDDQTPEEDVQDMLRWEIVSCLLGTNWEHPEILEALEAGVSRDAIMASCERDRARLIDQAKFLGAALCRFVDRV